MLYMQFKKYTKENKHMSQSVEWTTHLPQVLPTPVLITFPIT